MTPKTEDQLEVDRIMEVIRLLNRALGHCYTYLEELHAANETQAERETTA